MHSQGPSPCPRSSLDRADVCQTLGTGFESRRGRFFSEELRVLHAVTLLLLIGMRVIAHERPREEISRLHQKAVDICRQVV